MEQATDKITSKIQGFNLVGARLKITLRAQIMVIMEKIELK
jgi:hypothetical protein